MAEREPLDIQPLVDKFPTQPGEKNLLLGECHRVDLGHGIIADIYAKHRVMQVDTPIEAFTLTGLRTVTIWPDRVEFLAERNTLTASLTLFPDGSLVNEVKPLSPLPASATFPLPAARSETEAAPEEEPVSFKGNIGRDPRPVTTDQGQMYFYPFGIHTEQDKTKPQEKQKATWVKVGIPIGQETLILDPALVSEANPQGLKLREGDFVQLVLVPGQWKELSVANKQKSELRTKDVSGYFLKESTMLKQKHR